MVISPDYSITVQMSRSYRDISRWATIRIVSRRIDTVSIYRHIVSSLIIIGIGCEMRLHKQLNQKQVYTKLGSVKDDYVIHVSITLSTRT